MKKLLLVVLFVVSTAAACLAQQNNKAGKFTIGLELGKPTEDGRLFTTFAVGGSVRYDLPVSSHTYLTLSGGYTSLRGKDGWAHTGFIPLKAGLKYYLHQGLYAEGQIGAVIVTRSDGGTGLAYAPGIGYSFGSGFDLGLRYERWLRYGDISQVGLRAGLSF